MIEIDEVMPFYICGEKVDAGECIVDENHYYCSEECHHITNPMYAKNKETIKLFEKFVDTFDVIVDDNGRLVCIEKR